MEGGIIREAKVGYMFVPSPVVFLDKRNYHCFKYSIDSLDWVRLRVVRRYRRMRNVIPLREILHDFIYKLGTIICQ